jgi:hypothetical protein
MILSDKTLYAFKCHLCYLKRFMFDKEHLPLIYTAPDNTHDLGFVELLIFPWCLLFILITLMMYDGLNGEFLVIEA